MYITFIIVVLRKIFYSLERIVVKEVHRIIFCLILNIQSLEPDPILRLKRIVGFGGCSFRDVSIKSTINLGLFPMFGSLTSWNKDKQRLYKKTLFEFPFQALWSPDGSTVVYPCHAVVIAMKVNNGHQRFFIGHTDKVWPNYWYTYLEK